MSQENVKTARDAFVAYNSGDLDAFLDEYWTDDIDYRAVEGALDVATLTSIDFALEWPPKSGRIERFPEAEKARWMTIGEARAVSRHRGPR